MTQIEFNEEEDDDFNQLIKENIGKPTFVIFYGEWCESCKALKPKLEKICKENDFNLIAVNVDDNPEVSENFGFKGIPYVILFINGEKVFKFTGNTQDKLDEAVKLAKK